MSVEEAEWLAKEEGLALERCGASATGYKNVSESRRIAKPFKAQRSEGGRRKHVGNFRSAHEAALAVH